MSGFGPRLREERERLGLTQRVFGDVGGVEPNAQGKYESGERTPRMDYLAAVAARGVDALYVLTGTPTPAPSIALPPTKIACSARFAACRQTTRRLSGTCSTGSPARWGGAATGHSPLRAPGRLPERLASVSERVAGSSVGGLINRSGH